MATFPTPSHSVLSSSVNSKRQKLLFEFTQGIDVDSRLAKQEISVQLAWARGLQNAGNLNRQEFESIEQTLAQAWELMQTGQFDWRVEDEDVHMNLERFVTEKLGQLGKKMHSGRSRNDLIATTLRLFVRDQISQICLQLTDLASVLIERAEKDVDVLVPGLTHVQNGQPVRHGHVLVAHAWAFARDLRRLNLAQESAEAVCPLGSAALSGTAIDIDLENITAELGFKSPALNSYDAVGDRDFIIESIDAFASLGVHLSRLSEDCILWASTPFRLVKLPPEWSTGSSIMPNKRNPDVPELIRGKSSHLIACATNAHVLLKGMPTSYGSDLHELKSVLMRAIDEAEQCLGVFPPFIRGLEVDRQRAQELLVNGHILATEIADELTAHGLPFREAYQQVAQLVKRADELKVQVHHLPEAEWKKLAPTLSESFVQTLTFESAVEKRQQAGGTSLKSFREGVSKLRATISDLASKFS